jgi:hypothetical protein
VLFAVNIKFKKEVTTNKTMCGEEQNKCKHSIKVVTKEARQY